MSSQQLRHNQIKINTCKISIIINIATRPPIYGRRHPGALSLGAHVRSHDHARSQTLGEDYAIPSSRGALVQDTCHVFRHTIYGEPETQVAYFSGMTAN